MESPAETFDDSRDCRRLLQDLMMALGVPRSDIPIVFYEVDDTSLASSLIQAMDGFLPKTLPSAVIALPPPGSSGVKIDNRFTRRAMLNMTNPLISYQRASLGQVTLSWDGSVQIITLADKDGVIWTSQNRLFIGSQFEFVTEKVFKHELCRVLLESAEVPKAFLALQEYGFKKLVDDKPATAMTAMAKKINKDFLEAVDTYVKSELSMATRFSEIRMLRGLRKKFPDYSKIPFFASSVGVSAIHNDLLYYSYLVETVGPFSLVLSKKNRLKNLLTPTGNQVFSICSDPRFADSDEENDNSVLVFDSFECTEKNRESAASFFECGKKDLCDVAVQSAVSLAFLENVKRGAVLIGFFGRNEKPEVSVSSYIAIRRYLVECGWVTGLYCGPLPHNGYFCVTKGYGKTLSNNVIKSQTFLVVRRAHLANLQRYLFELTAVDFSIKPAASRESVSSLSVKLSFSNKRSAKVDDEDKSFTFFPAPTGEQSCYDFEPEDLNLSKKGLELINKFNETCSEEHDRDSQDEDDGE